MAVTIASPTGGVLQIQGAVILCTLSGGVVTPITSIGQPMAFDIGWVGTESAGDKAQGLVNYTAPGSFSGADSTDVGLIQDVAAQVVRLTNVVQALQVALADSKLPNVGVATP